MDISEELAEIDRAINQTEDQVVCLQAELDGMRAKRSSLEAALRSRTGTSAYTTGSGEPLSTLTQLDAIVRVLRDADGPMTIQDVRQGLIEGGRDAPGYAPIASSLSMLTASGRIERPSRGRYRA